MEFLHPAMWHDHNIDFVRWLHPAVWHVVLESWQWIHQVAAPCNVVLCDTHDTSILIVDTYVTIPVSPRSRYTAVYHRSTKYRETAQVSRVSMIPCSLYHLATCTLQACDAETNSKVTNKITIVTVQHWVCEQQLTSTILFIFIFFALAQHYWLHAQNCPFLKLTLHYCVTYDLEK